MIGNREKIASVLDLRVLRSVRGQEWKDAKEALEEEYIKFSVQYFNKYERQLAKEAEVVDVDVPAPLSTTEKGPARKRLKTESAFSNRATLGISYEDQFIDSDSDDASCSSQEDVRQPSEEEKQKQDAEEAKLEFRKVVKKWRHKKVNWRELYPDEKLPEGRLDLIRDLMKLDIGVLYKDIQKNDQSRSTYGMLPLMASCCQGQVGALNAESFAERCNSTGKLILSEGNSLLASELISTCTILRMNRDFMTHMRQHYAAEVRKIRFFDADGNPSKSVRNFGGETVVSEEI